MQYRFPCTKFVLHNTFRQQVEHVISEAQELLSAIDNIEGTFRIKEETVDLLHSTETLLRKLVNSETSEEVSNVITHVITKNADRDYYLHKLNPVSEGEYP